MTNLSRSCCLEQLGIHRSRGVLHMDQCTSTSLSALVPGGSLLVIACCMSVPCNGFPRYHEQQSLACLELWVKIQVWASYQSGSGSNLAKLEPSCIRPTPIFRFRAERPHVFSAYLPEQEHSQPQRWDSVSASRVTSGANKEIYAQPRADALLVGRDTSCG
jgi:hypothetical protein